VVIILVAYIAVYIGDVSCDKRRESEESDSNFMSTAISLSDRIDRC
jgi:hypothetical protein